MQKFEIGKTYKMRSICNQECVWSYTVTGRTNCTVTLKADDGKVLKCRISRTVSTINNEETVYPLGKYSMCPTLSA